MGGDRGGAGSGGGGGEHNGEWASGDGGPVKGNGTPGGDGDRGGEGDRGCSGNADRFDARVVCDTSPAAGSLSIC